MQLLGSWQAAKGALQAGKTVHQCAESSNEGRKARSTARSWHTLHQRGPDIIVSFYYFILIKINLARETTDSLDIAAGSG